MATIDTIADRSTGSAIAGKAYFETSTNKFIVYNGSAWIEIDSDGTGAVFENRWGASFDGNNDYFTLTSPLVATGAYTLSMWFKQTKDALGILAYGATKYIEPSGSTGRILFSGYGGINTAAGSYTFGEWSHLMLARDSSNSVQVWLNGISAGTGSHSGNATFDRFGIYNGSVQPFGGEIDDIAYWDSDQTSNLSAIYSGGVPTDLSSLTPTGYWRMGDDSNDSPSSDPTSNSIAAITDSSGNGNDMVQATASKQPAFKALDQSTTSVSFDGSNDYLEVPHSTNLELTTAMTWSVWVNMNTTHTTDYPYLFAKWSSGNTHSNYAFYTQIDSIPAGYFVMRYWDGTTALSSSTHIPRGQWVHLAAVHNGTGLTYYVNGVADNTITVTAGSTNTGNLIIGRAPSGVRTFPGEIDEAAIFNSALSASDVASLASSRGAHVVNDLSLSPTAYYRMGEDDSLADGDTVTGITDASGNGNHATTVAANQPTASVDPIIYV